MPDPARQPAFPAVRALILLTVLAAALWAAGLLLLPGLIAPAEVVVPQLHAAALLVWVLNVVAVVVLSIADPLGVKAFTTTYFVSMMVKMAGVFLGARLLIATGRIESGKPLAASLALMYLPLLAAEVALIAIYLRTKYPSPSPVSKGNAAAHSSTTKEVGT